MKTAEEAPRRGYHHGDLRRALLDAALGLIRTGDPASLSLREVARRAGVTYAAPYHHFPDKAALLAEVAEEGFRELGRRVDEALAGAGAAPAERLRAVVTAYLGFTAERPAHYRVMFLPEFKDRARFGAVHEAATGALGRLQGLIRDLVEDPAPGEIESLALAIWSLGHGFAALWNEGIVQEKVSDPAAAQRQMGEHALALIRGRMRGT